MPRDHIEKPEPCDSRQEQVKKRGQGHRYHHKQSIVYM